MTIRNLLTVGILLGAALAATDAEAHFFRRRYCGGVAACCYPCCSPMHAHRHRFFAHRRHPVCCVPICATPCAAPCGGCGPVMQSAPIYQMPMQPATGMTYAPQPVMTYQTVPQVQIQRQTYVENVPVVTYQNVTVDEGGYQMVWVPRPVTKTVAQTVMQPQTMYRDVAVQTQMQVAQMQMQYLPQQTVQYIPQTQLLGMSPGVAPTLSWAPAPMNATAGTIGIPNATYAPTIASLPGYQLQGEAAPMLGMSPLPPPAGYMATPVIGAQVEDWSTIQQRQAGSVVPQAAHAPSAATVWQSQLNHEAVTR